MNLTLRQSQSVFVKKVALLTLFAYEQGYELTFGDAYRDPRCPYGSTVSKHRERLAIDLNLFKDGKYLTGTSNHLELGTFWESLGGIWGGKFNDGNHYEWPI